MAVNATTVTVVLKVNIVKIVTNVNVTIPINNHAMELVVNRINIVIITDVLIM